MIIFLIIVIIGLIIALWYSHQEGGAAKSGTIKELQDKIEHLDRLLNIYADDEEEYEETIEALKNELSLMAENIAALKVDNEKLRHNANLGDVVADQKKRYENLMLQLNELEGSYQDRVAAVQKLADEKLYMMNGVNELRQEYQKWFTEVDNIKCELNEFKRFHWATMEALRRESENEVGWELQISPQEKRLVEVLEGLKKNYFELASDLSGIEWKRVWLPKIQELCGREGLDGKMGIYRLSVKGDEGKCYIGQAVNVKERWYTHIKKMVGVDGKGSERVYEYRPNEVWWEVVEEVGDRGRLDERERYWIEFYGAKEWGLNKK